MKPVVLLTGNFAEVRDRPSFVIARTYAQAVEEAGGVPLLAMGGEGAQECAQVADALLLTGGVDVHPARYGQAPSATNLMLDPERDSLEWALLEPFVTCRKPVLGICRGIQLLNVYFGGTLYQDIGCLPGGAHAGGVNQPVDLVLGTQLHRLFGRCITVNSYHHQAVNRLAPCLTATGYARKENGSFLEAFEHESLPVLGVQWHPERMTAPDELASGLTNMRPLFSWLIRAAQAQEGR